MHFFYEIQFRFTIFAVQNENQMKQYHIAAIGELNVDIILNRIESEPEIGKEKFAKDMTVVLLMCRFLMKTGQASQSIGNR